MKTVSLYEAKTHLSALVEAAAGGEEVIIAKNGRARARLLAIDAPIRPVDAKRYGFWSELDWDPKWSFSRDHSRRDRVVGGRTGLPGGI